MGERVEAPVKPGDIIAGKYRVEEILGVGGMGVVVAATHIQLDERVALKFLLPGAIENRESVARFAHEARAAVKIKSEHVVRVSDVGTLETGAPFMVMELLSGKDLARMLKERHANNIRGIDVTESVDYVLQALEAIAEAHLLGIVHRDLKPANLFLVRRRDGSPCVKVLDFGISKADPMSSGGAGAAAALTSTNAVFGSPLYMSPEQWKSARDVDPRADIWSIGAILFELLSGRPPFEGEGMPQLYLNVVEGTPPSLSDVRPEVTSDLERVILRCLQKNKADRFRNAGELAMALAPFGSAAGRTSAERAAAMQSEPSLQKIGETTPAAAAAAAARSVVSVLARSLPSDDGSAPASSDEDKLPIDSDSHSDKPSEKRDDAAAASASASASASAVDLSKTDSPFSDTIRQREKKKKARLRWIVAGSASVLGIVAIITISAQSDQTTRAPRTEASSSSLNPTPLTTQPSPPSASVSDLAAPSTSPSSSALATTRAPSAPIVSVATTRAPKVVGAAAPSATSSATVIPPPPTPSSAAPATPPSSSSDDPRRSLGGRL